MIDPGITAFLVAFVAGPILASVLLRLPARLLIGCSLTVIKVTGIAIVLQWRNFLGSLLLLWLGRVPAVVTIPLAIRRRLRGAGSPAGRKWRPCSSRPIPWFGRATAQMMV